MGNLAKIKLLNDLILTPRWIYEWNIPARRQLVKAEFSSTVLWLVLDGKKKVDIGGNRYELNQGDIVVIPPLVPRIGFHENGDYGHFRYITVGADIRIGSLEFVRMYNFPEVVSLPLDERWQRLVGRTRELLEQSNHMLGLLQFSSDWEHAPTEEAYGLNTEQTFELIDLQHSFTAWFGLICNTLKPWLDEAPKMMDPRLREICLHIKQNIEKPLSTAELANHAFLSESHLRLLFRKTFGLSPMEYVRRTRMDQARELLLNTTYRLSDIARMVGYEDIARFSRSFSKSEGMSAMAYRRRYRSDMN